jgi:hypothetical protein
LGPPIIVDAEAQVTAPSGAQSSNRAAAGWQRTGISEAPLEFEAAFKIAMHALGGLVKSATRDTFPAQRPLEHPVMTEVVQRRSSSLDLPGQS